MHGFISESTSKISDGLWSAVKLTLLSFLTSLLPQLFGDQVSASARLPLLVLLMAGGIFFLFRSLSNRLPDTNKAMSGMVAGLLLWQSVRFSGFLEQWQFFPTSGYLIWLGSAVLIILFWSRALPVGMRFTLLVIMVHWIGRLLLSSLASWSGTGNSPLLLLGSTRLVGVIIFVVALLFIVGHSSHPLQRRYAAIGLYSGILMMLLLY
jgi:hypothetical protein